MKSQRIVDFFISVIFLIFGENVAWTADSASKGQLISKCPFWFHHLDKITNKIFLNFCPEIFCTFLGASWKLFGDPCRLPYAILHTKSQESPKFFHEAPRKLQKKLRAEIQNYFRWYFCPNDETKRTF